jgi:hypothetical protein
MMLAVLAPWFTCLAFDVLPPGKEERTVADAADQRASR